MVIDTANVEVVCIGVHLILIGASAVGQERADIAVVLECPAMTGQLDLDVDALLGEVGLDFLDGVANFHLVLSLITYII